MNATTAMNTATPVNVAGSVGLMLNSCACSSRVRPNEAARPGDEPDDRQPHPLASIIPSTLPRVAPSAMWIPISFVRSLTEYDRMP